MTRLLTEGVVGGQRHSHTVKAPPSNTPDAILQRLTQSDSKDQVSDGAAPWWKYSTDNRPSINTTPPNITCQPHVLDTDRHSDGGSRKMVRHDDDGSDAAMHGNSDCKDTAMHSDNDGSDMAMHSDNDFRDAAMHCDNDFRDAAMHSDNNFKDAVMHSDNDFKDAAMHGDNDGRDMAMHSDNDGRDAAMHGDNGSSDSDGEVMSGGDLRQDQVWREYSQHLRQASHFVKGKVGWPHFDNVFMVSALDGDGVCDLKVSINLT